VAAAADLAPVERALVEAFRQATRHEVRFALGSSGMLARQIQNGAPYDAYLSANQEYVTELAAAGRLVPASVVTYAFGRLGLWSKNSSIRSLRDLRRVRHVALANPAHAPYGQAARELLEKQGLWKALSRKIVYGENVRQAFQFAESGNADAAVTAWSLVHDRGGVLLEEAHTPIRQAGGVVAASPRRAAAARFLLFLLSAEGRKILAQSGFTLPAPAQKKRR
jgi:molybdate transport system substrate-binding protein